MDVLIIIGVAGLIALTFTSQISEKIGVASPLILLALGVAIGFLPQVGSIEIAPKILLEVILPPLLFAAAVSMPVMDFRRDLLAVASLAVGLVAISAVVLGAVVHWLVPEIPLAWAIGLGAVISPTDAVAITMTKRQGVAQRVVTVLEGEGLFNDATALVLLATATNTAQQVDGGTVNPGAIVWEFIYALVVAVVIGWVSGELGIRVRAWITEPATDTVFSFAMPFIASVPASALGGSGLVAAVVAGLVVSHRRVQLLPAWNRRFAQFNWRTVELLLESFVFLTMGLQAYGIVADVTSGSSANLGISRAVLLAVIVGGLTLVVRAVFVTPILWWIGRRNKRVNRRRERSEERLQRIESRLANACNIDDDLFDMAKFSPEQWSAAIKQWHKRVSRGWKGQRRRDNDLAYFMREPLGVREGAIVVWAGMRGAVTLAAAQTLPLATPGRSFLLLIALLVSAGSLAIQGLSLPWVIRLVKPMKAEDVRDAAERDKLLELLASTLKDSALAEALETGRSAAKRPVAESMVLAHTYGSHLGMPAVAAAGGARDAAGSASVGSSAIVSSSASAGTAADSTAAVGSASAGEVRDAAAAGSADASAATTAAASLADAQRTAKSGSPHDDVMSMKEASEERAKRNVNQPLTEEQIKNLALEAIREQREALMDARDEGVFSVQALEDVLERLDHEEIMLTSFQH